MPRQQDEAAENGGNYSLRQPFTPESFEQPENALQMEPEAIKSSSHGCRIIPEIEVAWKSRRTVLPDDGNDARKPCRRQLGPLITGRIKRKKDEIPSQINADRRADGQQSPDGHPYFLGQASAGSKPCAVNSQGRKNQ